MELISFAEMWAEIKEIPLASWLTVVVVAALGASLFVTMPKKWSAKMLASGALCLAASFVLSYIQLVRMPYGGSITLVSMLPIMTFAYFYGVGPGLVACLGYSLLQCLQGVYYYSLPQFLLDYIVGFTVMGFAGLGKTSKLPEKAGYPIGLAIGGLLRTLSSFLSGFLFFAEYAPEGMNPVWYSFVYNFSSLGVDTLLCVVAGVILAAMGVLHRLRPKKA